MGLLPFRRAALLAVSASALAVLPPHSASAAAAFASPDMDRGAHVGANRWGPPPHPRPTARLSAATHSAGSETGASEENDEPPPRSLKTRDVLSLPSIRSTLIRQEETIIFALIERAQFRRNGIVYQKGGFGDLGLPMGSKPCPDDDDEAADGLCGKMSFLEYMLAGTEALHCAVRRYTSPEEHPFFPSRLPDGPLDNLPNLDYPTDLLSPDNRASDVNFNPILLEKYIDAVVPSLTENGDDEQHGSTVLADIAALQALSRRVHYGKFVAESKYRSDPEGYRKLVEADDAEGVMALLTNEAVERQVLRRAGLKAATYGREPLLAGLPDISDFAGGGGAEEVDPDTAVVAAAAASAVVAAVEAVRNDRHEVRRGKVDPAVIEGIYRDIIIPLTKDIEVAYLFRRCGREPPPEYAPDRMSVDVLKETKEERAVLEAKAP